ncbi:MAG: hypothetical protein MEQ07_06140 [Aquimonas sp.]|nr:hypothetical protein [Aquimonas sp.]
MNRQAPLIPPEHDDAGWRALGRQLTEHAQPDASTDSWPALAAQLPPRTATRSTPARRSRQLWLGAVAAALALMVGGQLHEPPPRPIDPAAEVLLREAQALEREFSGAYRLLSQTPQPDEIRSALQQLEREGQAIHAALEQQPGSQRLFDQLRRTHELRLRLLLRGSELAA